MVRLKNVFQIYFDNHYIAMNDEAVTVLEDHEISLIEIKWGEIRQHYRNKCKVNIYSENDRGLLENTYSKKVRGFCIVKHDGKYYLLVQRIGKVRR